MGPTDLRGFAEIILAVIVVCLVGAFAVFLWTVKIIAKPPNLLLLRTLGALALTLVGVVFLNALFSVWIGSAALPAAWGCAPFGLAGGLALTCQTSYARGLAATGAAVGLVGLTAGMLQLAF